MTIGSQRVDSEEVKRDSTILVSVVQQLHEAKVLTAEDTIANALVKIKQSTRTDNAHVRSWLCYVFFLRYTCCGSE